MKPDRRQDDPTGEDYRGQRNGWWSGLPWQAKTAIIVLNSGVAPLLFIGYLLARDAGWIPSPLLAHAQKSEAALVLFADHRKQTEDISERIATGFRIVCQNLAKTDAERNNCTNIR